MTGATSRPCRSRSRRSRTQCRCGWGKFDWTKPRPLFGPEIDTPPLNSFPPGWQETVALDEVQLLSAPIGTGGSASGIPATSDSTPASVNPLTAPGLIIRPMIEWVVQCRFADRAAAQGLGVNDTPARRFRAVTAPPAMSPFFTRCRPGRAIACPPEQDRKRDQVDHDRGGRAEGLEAGQRLFLEQADRVDPAPPAVAACVRRDRTLPAISGRCGGSARLPDGMWDPSAIDTPPPK